MDREANLANWIERAGIDPNLFDAMTAAALRERFDLTILDAGYVAEVIQWLESPEMVWRGVGHVNHNMDMVEQLSSINRVVSITSSSIIVVLAVLSVVIIMNTIRLTIDGRKTEIGIMKFIGSTNWFIRWPFILEGMILGAIGSLVPIMLIVSFYDRLVRSIMDNVVIGVRNDILLSGSDIFPGLIPTTLIIGALLGTFSSFVTIRKYLDV
jgi:cell division transport system permease protein